MSLRHGFVSAAADSANANKLRPSNWGSTSTDYDTDPTHVLTGGALGSLLYRDTGSIDGMSFLADVSAGSVLVSGGVGASPAWSDTPTLTSLTLVSALTPANGGTGLSSYTTGDLIYASGAAALSKLADVATGSVLVSGGVATAPAWSASPTLTRVFVGDGTAALPPVSFASNPTTGFYLVSSNVLGFSTAGIQRGQWSVTGIYTNGLFMDTVNQNVQLWPEAADHSFWRRSTVAQRASWANTYASATSYEAFSVDWQTQANVAIVGTRTAATGTGRQALFGSQLTNASTSFAGITTAISAPFIRLGLTTTALGAISSLATTGNFIDVFGQVTETSTSGSRNIFAILPTYNQASGNAANTDLLIKRTQTAIGSGAQLLIDAQVGSTSMFSVSNTGVLTTAATTFMHSTSATLANGAGAQTGTLTNAPAAGNPTKWIPINDNGTTRHIPAW